MAGPAPDKRPRDEHPDARVPGSGPRSAADRASPAAEPDAGASRSPVERVLERTLVDDSGLGRPLSRRAATTQRTVEAYLKTGVRPRWMERVVEIDQGIARRAAPPRARLPRARAGVRPRPRAVRPPAGATSPAAWRFDPALNGLIEQHNEWYPVERRLPMNPRTGDYVPVGGRSYRRPRARARMGARAVPGVAAGGRLSGGRPACRAQGARPYGKSVSVSAPSSVMSTRSSTRAPPRPRARSRARPR